MNNFTEKKKPLLWHDLLRRKLLNFIIVIILFLTTGLSSTSLFADTPPTGHIDVLFIGNSFTFYNGMPFMFGQIAQQAGKDVTVDNYVIGGQTLYGFWTDPNQAALNKIKSKAWNYVVLQGWNDPAADMRDYGTLFMDEIRKVNPNAIILMYFVHPTGPYPDDATMNSQQSIYEQIHAQRPYAELVPVFWAWKQGFLEDPTNANWLDPGDNWHPGPRRSYISAVSMYSSIYLESPVGLTNVTNTYPGNISLTTSDAAYLQNLAFTSLKNHSTIKQFNPPRPTTGNLVSNPGFEEDNTGTFNPLHWTKWQANSADVNVNYTESSGGAAPAHSGSYYGVHYKATAWQQVNSIQNLTGLANGTYTLSAYVKSTAAIGSMYAGLFDSNKNYITTAIPVTNSWTQISMDVTVTNGQCEIGFLSTSSGNQWIAYDDVSFSLKAGGIVSGSTYEIAARHSGKALDVTGGPTATQDGANVQQWTYGGGSNQQWKVTDVGGGYYKLTAKHSGKCLDVNASGTTDGTNVQQWTDNGTDAQKWSITDVGNGYYELVAKCCRKALDVAAASSADGANVQQWTYGGGTNQQWAFTLISSAARTSQTTAKKVAEESEAGANTLNVYPNPANGIANVSYTATHNEQIAIHLYDTQGRLVKTIFTGTALKGVAQNYPVDGSSLREGLYIIKLKTSSETINKKVIFDN